MFLPHQFSVSDQKLIFEVLKTCPLITLVSLDPQWRHFNSNNPVWALINGPNAYITPSWYKTSREVPTWNYVSLELKCQVELLPGFSEITDILEKLTLEFESKEKSPWNFELPDDLQNPEALTKALMGFRLRVTQIEAKFKLSQNRSLQDQAGVLEGLTARSDDNSRKIHSLMTRLLRN